jgi:glycosyltransferase involved in cell wall biosynthesis
MAEPTPYRVLSVMHGPVFGGAHNQLVRLHPELRAAGFETVAAVPLEAEGAAARIEAAGIEVLRLPLVRFRGTAGPLTNLRTVAGLRGEVRAIRDAIRSHRVDLVQAHAVINLQAAAAAQREGVAIAWQLLDTRAPMALRRLTMPYVTRRADVLVSWGAEVARAHPGAEGFGDRLVVVYPPVDPDLAPDAGRRAAARERFRAGPATPVVGTLGVRQPQKGHEYFVRAAAGVHRERPEVAFRLLGEPSPRHGPQMQAVEAEAADLGLPRPVTIEFIDPGGDALGLLQGLDVFVLTSLPHSEGMPTAILEAMACGKAVVSTDVGSVRELVEDGVTGIVVPPRDAEAISRAVLQLVADPELRERMGAAGRARARTSFALDQLGQLHAGAYRKALAHRRSD